MAREMAVPARETVGMNRYAEMVAPYTLTILRVIVGLTFLLTGLPKWSNLGGFSGFIGSLGVPMAGAVGPLIATLEVVGGLLLIVGFAVRWVSILFFVEMLITTLLVKMPNAGFIAPQGKGVGAELDLLLLAGALVLFGYGAGMLSIERNVLKRDI
jgi:putative oxidoreductase